MLPKVGRVLRGYLWVAVRLMGNGAPLVMYISVSYDPLKNLLRARNGTIIEDLFFNLFILLNCRKICDKRFSQVEIPLGKTHLILETY